MGVLSKSPANHAEQLRTSQRVLEVLLDSHGITETLRLLQRAYEAETNRQTTPGQKIEADFIALEADAFDTYVRINELLDAAYYAIKKLSKI